MTDDLTVLALRHEATARALAKYQIDPADVFRAAGLDPVPYRDPDGRLRAHPPAVGTVRSPDEESVHRVRERVCVRCRRTSRARPRMAREPDVREALGRLVRYHRLLSTAVEMRLEERDRGDVVVAHRVGRAWPLQAIDALMHRTSSAVPRHHYDDFRRSSVRDATRHATVRQQLARFFGCPVHYGAERDAIAFQRTQVEKFLPRQNPALARASDEVALRYIAHMDRSDVLSARNSR